ncbi:MAG: hypothetical protein JO159_15185 [Acidobacteria bacterium]|nr:hypothetical protein [Acidobacteriota bacterium]
MTNGRVFPIDRKITVLTLILAAFSPAAAAQKFLKLPSVEIFGGYSYLHFQSTTLGFSKQLNMSGAIAGISIPIYAGLGISGDASAHYSGALEAYYFMAGPQYRLQWRALRLTGHGLFGKGRSRLRNPGTTFNEPSTIARAWAVGGELDVPLRERMWLRPLEADYVTTSAFGSTLHNLRISSGLIFIFGKH